MTGAGDEARANELRARLSDEEQPRYVVRAYVDDMPAAMHAADVFVGRAGASTLGELPAAALPAVLVPGEYEGWSQAPNAEYLQARGAAVMLRNRDLPSLGGALLALLRRPVAARIRCGKPHRGGSRGRRQRPTSHGSD